MNGKQSQMQEKNCQCQEVTQEVDAPDDFSMPENPASRTVQMQDILADIDEVLSEEAQSLVASYVQASGQ
ncbi:hypothetical protein BK816_03970 [Boudabousia tangfeifanii]|uniref:Prokaryotic ubiquitin-like protein Pup n=1 Tax=Boudabousia tangfeifanii TaxID=1912795 RepID=A0A1D9MJU3_9ACTO|nr:ubiquitin-like protein Pup [Boudabousia tangfeifanii]AOZ72556.1 hypothetical protein BK816_03970 [Boudabousia tangfeifanii]